MKVQKLVDPIRSLALFSTSEPSSNQIEKIINALSSVVINHGLPTRFKDENNEQNSLSTYITLRSKGKDQIQKIIKFRHHTRRNKHYT